LRAKHSIPPSLCHCCLLQVETSVSLRGKIVPSAGGANAAGGAKAAEPSFPRTAQNLSPTGPVVSATRTKHDYQPSETRADRRPIAEIVRNSTPRIVAGQSVGLVTHRDLPVGNSAIQIPDSLANAAKYEAMGGSRICDVVVVESQRCERSRSQELAEEAANFNAFTMPKTGHIC